MAVINTYISTDNSPWAAGMYFAFRENSVDRIKAEISGELTKRVAYTGAALFTDSAIPCFVNVLYSLQLVSINGRVLHTFFSRLKPGEIEKLDESSFIFKPNQTVLNELAGGENMLLVRLLPELGVMLNQPFTPSHAPVLPETLTAYVVPSFQFETDFEFNIFVKDFYDRQTGATITAFTDYDTIKNSVFQGESRYVLVKDRTKVRAVAFAGPSEVRFENLTADISVTSAAAGGICSGMPQITSGNNGFCFETGEFTFSENDGKVTLKIGFNIGGEKTAQSEVLHFCSDSPACISAISFYRCAFDGTVSAESAENEFIHFNAGVLRLRSYSPCTLKIKCRQAGSAGGFDLIALFDTVPAISSFAENGYTTGALQRDTAYTVRFSITDNFSGEEIYTDINVPMADFPENADAVIFGAADKTVSFPWRVLLEGGFCGKTVSSSAVISQLSEPGLYFFPALNGVHHKINDSDSAVLSGEMGMLVFGSQSDCLHVLFENGNVRMF